MKLLAKCLIAAIILIHASCEECGECFSPPSDFHFEFLDAENKENLFTNGTFKSDQISILNQANNNKVAFQFIDENDLNVLVINSIGWETEQITLSIQISDNEVFTLYVDAQRVSEKCCSFTRYQKVEVKGVAYEIDEYDYQYQILI